VTVEGIFESALHLGLSFIGDEDVLARLNQAREDDVIVYGVQRKDGKDAGRTSGCVLRMVPRLYRSSQTCAGMEERSRAGRIVGRPKLIKVDVTDGVDSVVLRIRR